MTEQKIPDYETIKAAVAGEKRALDKVVDCFGGEIDKLSTITKQLPNSTTEKENRRGSASDTDTQAVRGYPDVPS